MYLTGHAAVGIAASAAMGITNPIGAFVSGWLSHYIADAFPHGDEEVGEWCKKGEGLRRIIGVFLIDVVILGVIAVVYVLTTGFSWWAFAATVGSTVPDVMWGIEMVVGRKVFGPHDGIHHANHNLPGVVMPAWVGLVLQAFAAGLLWWHVMH